MELRDATVAVTGATGFIGRYLVRALTERGARAVAVVRNPARAEDLGVEVRPADLTDRAALERAFRGVDAVMANAALVSLGHHSRAALVDANVTGTRNVLDAMAGGGVRRGVLTSSALVYRPKRDHFYAEDDPLRSDRDWSHRFNHYAVSKALSEREAFTRAAEHGIDLSAARPHTVFGAFDRSTFSVWLRRLMRPPVTVFPTHLAFPAVYAGDLAEAMCRMLERDAARGRAYNVASEPGTESYWDLMRAFCRARGAGPRLVLPLPVPLQRRYDTRRARAELGLVLRPPEEGFRDMLAWEAA